MTPDQRTQLTQHLARLGAGDRSCATRVFESLWPVLRRFCGGWLEGSADADDCAQRAISKVFAQASGFDASRDALAWALELASWECRTTRAQLTRSRTDPLSQAAPTVDGADPHTALEQAELRAALHSALEQLPAGDRDELQRVLAEELAGTAAARKRRQRAIERLKLLWRRLHGED